MTHLSGKWDTCQVPPFQLWHATYACRAAELRIGCTSVFKWLSCHILGKCCTECYRRERTRMLHQEAFATVSTICTLGACHWGNPLVRVWPVSSKDDAVLVQRWGPCSAVFAQEVLGQTSVEHVHSRIRTGWSSPAAFASTVVHAAYGLPPVGLLRCVREGPRKHSSGALQLRKTPHNLLSSVLLRTGTLPCPPQHEGKEIPSPLLCSAQSKGTHCCLDCCLDKVGFFLILSTFPLLFCFVSFCFRKQRKCYKKTLLC